MSDLLGPTTGLSLTGGLSARRQQESFTDPSWDPKAISSLKKERQDANHKRLSPQTCWAPHSPAKHVNLHPQIQAGNCTHMGEISWTFGARQQEWSQLFSLRLMIPALWGNRVQGRKGLFLGGGRGWHEAESAVPMESHTTG